MATTHATDTPLRAARRKAGLTTEEVARLVWPPVNPSAILRWERGATPVEPWRLRQLAHIYHLPVRDLARLVGVPVEWDDP